MDVEEGDLSSVVFARLSGRSRPAAGPIARMDLPYPLPAPLYNTAAAAAAVFQSLSLPSTSNIMAASPMPFSPCRTSSQLPIPPQRIPLLPPPNFINHSTAPPSYSYGVNSSSYPFFAAPKAYNYKERGLVDTMPSVNQVLPRVIKEKADLTNTTGSGFGIEDSPMVLSGNSQSNTSHPSTSKRNPFVPHNKKSQGSIPKRRKEQQKRIVCVPSCGNGRPAGEFLPSDMWSWRKYGQKPIKGSPYPRSYYRCSSSKGCPARKQVERSRSDSNMLLITYMAEHNHPWPAHRNALAAAAATAATGSSSSKLLNPPQNDAAEQNIDDHSSANPVSHLGAAEEEAGPPYENDTDDAAYTTINNNNNNNNNCSSNNNNNNNNNIEMELQMLKYATEHLWGDDDDLFTDLDAGFPPH